MRISCHEGFVGTTGIHAVIGRLFINNIEWSPNEVNYLSEAG